MGHKNSKINDRLSELGVFLSKQLLFPENSRGVSAISTGSLMLDVHTGIGGWPKGKIIEFFGVDASGKTTLALHAAAQAQKLKQVVVYIDLENTLNLFWAQKIGVDIDNLYVSRPANGEKVFELIRNLLSLDNVGLIIVDSVAALVPSVEFENHMEDQTMGLHARLMSKGLRVIQSLMIGKSTSIIFINQVRDKIGGNSFIPVTVTTGGRALKYSASMRVEVKRAERIQDSSGNVVGFEIKCIIVKNKFGAPFACAKTAIYFDTGFDVKHEIISELLDKKILIKKGSWIEFQNKNLAQGVLQLRQKMTKDSELYEKLKRLAFPNCE